MPILTVDLGDDASVTNEPVYFLQNGLSMTSDHYQYTNEEETAITVQYLSTNEFPKPTAVIGGASIAYECDEFYFATGQESTGRLRRNLSYEWTVNGSIVGYDEVLLVVVSVYA